LIQTLRNGQNDRVQEIDALKVTLAQIQSQMRGSDQDNKAMDMENIVQ